VECTGSDVCDKAVLLNADADVFSYRLRIEALLLKEEFNQTVDWLKPSIDAVIISARGSSMNFELCFVLLYESVIR